MNKNNKGKSKASNIQTKWKNNDLFVNCKKCGEKIEISNDMGVFCKNLCGYDESKEAYEKINKIFGGLLGKTTLKQK